MAQPKKIDLTKPLNMIYDIAETIGELKVDRSSRLILAGVIDRLVELQSLLEEIG